MAKTVQVSVKFKDAEGNEQTDSTSVAQAETFAEAVQLHGEESVLKMVNRIVRSNAKAKLTQKHKPVDTFALLRGVASMVKAKKVTVAEGKRLAAGIVGDDGDSRNEAIDLLGQFKDEKEAAKAA